MFLLNIYWILDAYSTVLLIRCFALKLLWHSGSQSVLRRYQFLGDQWINLCNGNIKFIYFLNWRNNVLLTKEIIYNWQHVNVLWPSEYLIKKLPLPMMLETIFRLQLRPNHAVQCYSYIMVSISNQLGDAILQFSISLIRTLYIYVSKDVGILGYFSKPKGIRK